MLTTLLLMFATALATTLWFVASRRRRTRLVHFSSERLPIEEGLATLAGLTNASVYRGNAATIFQDGALFDAMERDIQAARHNVHLETFVWTKGELERRTVDLLCRRSAEGVTVRVIVDSVGASEADDANFERMRREKVELVVYRAPLRWNPRRLNHRTHRKLLVVDGEVGYTFGHGFADHWLGH
ncbi:MAG: phospholipase D-like domain-containing protein, partial [Panacagrimonas sp.]